MSYANGDAFYQATDAFAMTPASVSDETTLPTDSCTLADRMEVSPWYYFVEKLGNPPTDCHVDWNRSSAIESSSYQAAIGMSKGDSCTAFSQKHQELAGPEHHAWGWQSATRGGDYLYVFTVEEDTTDQKIVYRRAELGPSKSQPCTGPINDCLDFFDGVDLVTGIPVFSVASYHWDGFLFIAYSDDSDGTLKLRWYTIGADGVLTFVGQHSYPEFPSQMAEFVVQYDGTTSPALRVLWSVPLGASGFYLGATWDSLTDSWSSPSDFLVSCDMQLITGASTPAAVAWPDPHNPYAPYDYRTTCSLFPDGDGAARLFCYDHFGQCWADETPFAFPASSTPGGCPGLHVDVTYNILGIDIDFCVPEAVEPLDLAFVPRRNASGSQSSPYQGYGNLHLIFYGNGSSLCDHYVPAVWISEGISMYDPISIAPLWGGEKSAHWRDYFGNKWTCLQHNSNLSIYVDETMGSAMASASVFSSGQAELRFYPFADGSPDISYLPLSDFVVMEDHLCSAVKGGEASGFCY